MRKLWISLLSLACAATSIFALTGCGNNDKKTSLCTHTWEEEITKTPLCTVKGEATKTCTLCGEIETIEISSIGHKFQEHEAKAATCTDIGWTAYVECTREGCDYNNYQELPALEHLSQTHEAKAATCTEIGWNAYETCSRANCGYTTYEEIPALNHDEIPHDAQEATCTDIGWNAYVTCNRDGCGYTTYEEIPAMGHNFVDKVCDSCGTPYFSDGLSYRLNADEESYTLTGLGACRDLDVVIPATYNDLPVTSIQRSAFYNQFSLTSVTIGSNVVTIDDNAFEACSGLTSVFIPDTTVTIGKSVFQY